MPDSLLSADVIPARFHPNPGQAQADGLLAAPQRHTMLVGGSRSGKTFWLVRAMVIRALRAPGSRHAIVRFHGNAAWTAIALDTLPAVMAKCFPQVKLEGHTGDGYFRLPNGAEIWLGGLEDEKHVEKILGREYVTLYFNECSQIPYGSVLVALTRLAQNIPGLRQRAYYDLNPTGTGHWTYQLFVDHRNPETDRPLASPDEYGWMYLNPFQNAENLTAEYLSSLEELPERQRKRFLEGVYSAEIDGALWTLGTLESCRCDPADVPDLRRVVVAVDPSGAAGKEDVRSDEIGIVVAGKGVDGRAYVLADYTLRDSPSGWARRAIQAFQEHHADAVVAETNFGKAMVENTIAVEARNLGVHVPFKEVHASRGKVVRAEPVSALYVANKAMHVGRFDKLENQMLNMSTAGYHGSKSPDRLDAMVWALTELMVGPEYPSARQAFVPHFGR